MAENSGFFKGEKKKKKKAEGGSNFSIGPVFVPPTVIPKGKDKY